MKLNIEELAKQAGMNVSMWNYGAGSIVFTMGTDGVARGAVERFTKLIVERCAVELDKRYMGDNNREDMEARKCAEAIRNLLDAG